MDELERKFNRLLDTIPAIEELAQSDFVKQPDRVENRLRRLEQTLNSIVADQQSIKGMFREAKILVERATQISGRGA